MHRRSTVSAPAAGQQGIPAARRCQSHSRLLATELGHLGFADDTTITVRADLRFQALQVNGPGDFLVCVPARVARSPPGSKTACGHLRHDPAGHR